MTKESSSIKLWVDLKKIYTHFTLPSDEKNMVLPKIILVETISSPLIQKEYSFLEWTTYKKLNAIMKRTRENKNYKL